MAKKTVDPRTYDIGFKKPPPGTQFQPGQSGNPNGRPKSKPLNVAETFRTELNKMVKIQEGGETQEVRKLDVFVKSIINEAIKGRPSATKRVLDVIISDEKSSKIVRYLQDLDGNFVRSDLIGEDEAQE